MDILTFEGLPARIEDEAHLEDLLSTPTEALIRDLSEVNGDIMVLGVAGKVGPTLARLAKRACPEKRIIGVARFSDAQVKARLAEWGVETLSCDLLDRAAVEALPRVRNIIYMAGKKFGTEDDPSFAWAMNTHVPAIVADTFRDSRIVAFSTLCVYPMAPVVTEGWDERVPPMPPGEYANSCVGRERIFEFFSRRHGTPGRIMRLNYAIETRYGVLFDVAMWVKNRAPIPIAMGQANVIWQGDASSQMLRALKHCTAPASPLNIGGPHATSIRTLAHLFGERFGIEPLFDGEEAPDASVNDTSAAQRLFGLPLVPLALMVDWVADWIERGLPHHHKPTRYEVRDGRF